MGEMWETKNTGDTLKAPQNSNGVSFCGGNVYKKSVLLLQKTTLNFFPCHTTTTRSKVSSIICYVVRAYSFSVRF